MPLVLNFHSAGSNATFQEAYTQFSEEADRSGFLVAYPQGMKTPDHDNAHFNAWILPVPEQDDVTFARALIDVIGRQFCVDPARVFATGFSNGAMMSVRLACSLGDQIAAIAPVAGTYYPPDARDINDAETCRGERPVPMLAFHGTSDGIVPFEGGPGGLFDLQMTFRLPIDSATTDDNVMAAWAVHNGCGGARDEHRINTEVRLIRYTACASGLAVELYVIDGGGHTWPGAVDTSFGYTTRRIDATTVIWDFFAAHPLPTSVGGMARDVDASAIERYRHSTGRSTIGVRGPILVAGAAALVLSAMALVRLRRSNGEQ